MLKLDEKKLTVESSPEVEKEKSSSGIRMMPEKKMLNLISHMGEAKDFQVLDNGQMIGLLVYASKHEGNFKVLGRTFNLKQITAYDWIHGFDKATNTKLEKPWRLSLNTMLIGREKDNSVRVIVLSLTMISYYLGTLSLLEKTSPDAIRELIAKGQTHVKDFGELGNTWWINAKGQAEKYLFMSTKRNGIKIVNNRSKGKPARTKGKPDAVVPDAVVPDAVVPDAVVPDAVVPDAVE